MKTTEEQVLKAIYSSGLWKHAPIVLNTKWKDGIDIDEPSFLVMDFVQKVFDISAEKTATDKPKFFYGTCGCLMCDRPIEGLTQTLGDDSAKYYGSKFFICETIFSSAAKIIAEALGGEFVEKESGT